LYLTRFKRRFGSEMLPGLLDELWVKDIHCSGAPLREDVGPIDDLLLSIREKGVLEPIVVRPIQEGFEVVAGNRRLEACRRLGIRKVPCHIVGLDDKQAYEISLIENLQRRNLNPIEEARAFKKYVDEYGYGSLSELARRIGKSEPYVSKRISLLNLPKDVREQVVSRRIAPSIAEELLYLEDGEIGQIASKLFVEHVTRREVRNAIKNLKAVVGPPDDFEYARIEDSLRVMEKARSKCIASLQVCLMHIDDAMNSLEDDEWFVRENLAFYRRTVHQLIDRIIVLRKKSDSCAKLLTARTTDKRPELRGDDRTYNLTVPDAVAAGD
jgi:ParB family transcriptional regulator, chromosome partitioning protein